MARRVGSPSVLSASPQMATSRDPTDPVGRRRRVVPMEIQVVRSARRRKTVEARVVGGVIRVCVPARLSETEAQRHVEALVARLERRQAAVGLDLTQRADALARRLGLPGPASIRWVDNQNRRWGSCTPTERAVRISSRVSRFPPWVVDYVIVHELAHLVEPGHTARFWALVSRYPKAERARGYLMAKGGDGHDEDEHDADAGDGEQGQLGQG
jgi:predicted metal-dependent hydrolase